MYSDNVSFSILCPHSEDLNNSILSYNQCWHSKGHNLWYLNVAQAVMQIKIFMGRFQKLQNPCKPDTRVETQCEGGMGCGHKPGCTSPAWQLSWSLDGLNAISPCILAINFQLPACQGISLIVGWPSSAPGYVYTTLVHCMGQFTCILKYMIK